MTTTLPRTAIEYTESTHDFACLVDGVLVGRSPSWREAEALIERHILDLQRRQVAVVPPQKLALTAREAAEALSLPISTLYRHIKCGRIPAIRLGRQVRIPVAELKAKLQELVEQPTPELVATDPDILAIRPYKHRKKGKHDAP